MAEKREWTQAEMAEEARRRFGEDVKAWAFVCPNCGDEATIQDFLDAGDENAASAGQECIGRSLGALKKTTKKYTGRGCDWAAYGLFSGPWHITMPAEGDKPERKVASFALAATRQVPDGGGSDG